MYHFWTLLKHEWKRLFLSPTSYIIACLFLILMGTDYLFILLEYTHNPMDVSSVHPLFETFWLPTLFVVPLLTMKTLSEERRLGTLETLLATPTSLTSVILSKFFSLYSFYILLWLLTLIYPIIAQGTLKLASTHPPLYTADALIGGFIFILLSSGIFISVGLFTSALTKNQLVAGLFCFCVLFGILVGSKLLTDLPWWHLKGNLYDAYANFFQHLDELSRGILDTRIYIFYLTGTFLFLALTKIILEMQNLR